MNMTPDRTENRLASFDLSAWGPSACSNTPGDPVVLSAAQADELVALLSSLMGWLVDGDPDAHDDLAWHLGPAGPVEGWPDQLTRLSSVIDAWIVVLEEPRR